MLFGDRGPHGGAAPTLPGQQLPQPGVQLAFPEPPPPTTRVAKQLVKTRFCKHFIRGYCRYQEKCTYAHHAEELMPRPNLAKTKICVGFLTGSCSANDCSYAHGLSELRQDESSQAGGLASASLEELWADSAPAGPAALPFAGTNLSAASAAPNRLPAQVQPLVDTQHDQELLHEVLEEIMQLLIEEDRLEPYGRSPSAQERRWELLVSRTLRRRRRETLLEGKCLLGNDQKPFLTYQEEQLMVYLFLREPGWVELFPRLVSRCSRMMASRLGNALVPEDEQPSSEQQAAAVLSPTPEQSHRQRQLRGAPDQRKFTRSHELLPDLPDSQAFQQARLASEGRGLSSAVRRRSLSLERAVEEEDAQARDLQSLHLLTMHLERAC